MKITSLFIGNELLNGQTRNSNIITLGSELTAAGYQLNYSETIPDGIDVIKESILRNIPINDVIIICGGLGPTVDDITRKAVAKTLGAELGHSDEVRKSLQVFMEKKGKSPSEDYYSRQSEIIIGAEILWNSVGLAPGLLCEFEDTLIYLLPGPPREYSPMIKELVIPHISKLKPSHTHTELFHIYGVSESRVEDAFQPFLKKYSFVSPAYCANLGHVKLTISYSVDYLSRADELNQAVSAIFGDDITRATNLIIDVAGKLENKGWTLGTAESCTGGWIGQEITSHSGASSFFKGSVNTYANEWKVNLLGVNEKTLLDHGAVSEECATEMINGLCDKYNLDCGIAVTGVAGPGGGSVEKPVGTVYIATKTPENTVITKRLFGGNRKEVREQTVRYALNQLRLQLLG
jgi:nicotinamide-nucleotide amidase